MYKLGTTSLKRLEGVHPDLVKVVKKAIEITSVDFTVVEGLRSIEKQRENVDKGYSKTMNSRHLTGHAVDLAPWVNNTIDWKTEENFFKIADAMRTAAIEYNIEVLWGRAWLMAINYYPSAGAAQASYVAERKRQGRKPFYDGPHFQLTWRNYP
jgi:peptidoglycan L-alanyl-D-glutamate endopeptidase CwlK